jgi:phosphoribosylamine--glycine ligase
MNLQLAFDEAYKLTDIVNFDGVQFRTDIGKKALN